MLGKFIRETREERGLTQAQAAAQIGVAEMTWSNWERGLTPSLECFLKLADWSGISADELRTRLEGAA
jgi:transcriptional regulator with XRE-family HTH domain